MDIAEGRYEKIINTITDCIFSILIMDGHPVETIYNPGCITLTGYTEEEFREDPYLWLKNVHEQDRAMVREFYGKALCGIQVDTIEYRIFHKNGEIRWLSNTIVDHYDDFGNLIICDSLINDITENKQIDTAFQKSRKTEFIRTLMSGIAHDFNNLLSAIISYIELSQVNVDRKSQAHEFLNLALASCMKVSDLINRLVILSRDDKPLKKTGSTTALLKDCINFLLPGSDVKIVKRHKGHMAVKSKVGEGTILEIYLPAGEMEIEKTCEETERHTQKDARSGTGRIAAGRTKAT